MGLLMQYDLEQEYDIELDFCDSVPMRINGDDGDLRLRFVFFKFRRQALRSSGSHPSFREPGLSSELLSAELALANVIKALVVPELRKLDDDYFFALNILECVQIIINLYCLVFMKKLEQKMKLFLLRFQREKNQN